jgi:hypothetical protein
MAEEKYETPPEAPHFTSDEVSDADSEEKPAVAPELGSPLGAPEESAPDNVEIADEMTKTATKGPHN